MDRTPFTIAADAAKDRGHRDLARRIRTEGKIARKAAEALIAAGFTVGVNDGEETVLKRSTDMGAIVAALFSSDEDYLLAYDAAGKKVGWVYLVYGNSGYDLISDYSVNLTDALRPAENYAERLETAEHDY